MPNTLDSLTDIKNEMEERNNIPMGYYELKLSTKGLVAAPEKMLIRNFLPSEMKVLTMAPERDRPMKLIQALDKMIYNPENKPEYKCENFTEKEVVEIELAVFELFYTDVIQGLRWTLTDEDKAFMSKNMGGESDPKYVKWLKDVESDEIKLRYDLPLSAIKYYEIGDDFKKHVTVTYNKGGQNVKIVYSLPKFGDFLLLKEFMDKIYRKTDRDMSTIATKIENKREAREKLFKGEKVAYDAVEMPSMEAVEKYNEYTYDRTSFAITCALAKYIEEYNGVDLSKAPLDEKIKYVKDNPIISDAQVNAVEDAIGSIKYGYKEKVTVIDPVLQQPREIEFPFRVTTLLSAFEGARSSEFNICIN